MFHDNDIQILRMTPEELRNGYANLTVRYQFYETLFGKLVIASTDQGICYTGFDYDEGDVVSEMNHLYPKACFLKESDTLQENALAFFEEDRNSSGAIPVHIHGTDFQLKVWDALLRIPMGELSSYGKIALQIGHPKAYRAVGSAVGDNPVSLLIPCHRVVQASGAIGQYHWGAKRKAAILDWEKQIINK